VVQATPKRSRPSPALNHYKPSVARELPPLKQAPSPIFETDAKSRHAKPSRSKVSALADELGGLALTPAVAKDDVSMRENDFDDEADSMILLPKRKSTGKKMKKLGSKPVMTEEQIERAATVADPPAGKSVKRLTRSSR